MGYVREEDRQELFEKFGRAAAAINYVCDYKPCGKPIYGHEMMLVDQKAGFYKKDPKAPSFLPQQPKRTYHLHPCGDIVTGKRTEDGQPVEKKKKSRRATEPDEDVPAKPAGDVRRTAKAVLAMITAKPKPEYWTVSRAIRKYREKEGERKPVIRKAIRHLKDSGQLVKKGKFLYPAKKKSK